MFLLKNTPPLSQETKEAKMPATVIVKTVGVRKSAKPLKSSKSSVSRLGGSRRSTTLVSLPPTLNAVISCKHTFRFSCVNGFATLVNITGGALAGAIGGYCTTVNSAVTTIASSIRVHRVTVWPPAQASPQNPPEIVWFSPITIMEKDASKERLLPAGISVSAPLSERPPAKTLCADWFAVLTAVNQPVFGMLNVAAGAVIDVQLSWTISNNLLGASRTVATGVLGTYYYLYLDGSTGHFMQPVGKPTTF